MAALPGKNSAVKVVTTTVGFIDTFSFTTNMGSAETTAFGDTAKTAIPTIKDISGSFSGTYDKADSGQDSLLSELLTGDGAVTDLRLYVSAANYYAGNAVLTSFAVNSAVADKVTVSFSFIGNGAFTYN